MFFPSYNLLEDISLNLETLSTNALNLSSVWNSNGLIYPFGHKTYLRNE